MGWRARMDATKAQDLAAFEAPSRFSLLRVAVGAVALLAAMTWPLLMAPYVGPFAMVGFPLGMLVWTLVLSRTPAGRGALWTFGKGQSPSQRIVTLAILCAAITAFIAGWRALR